MKKSVLAALFTALILSACSKLPSECEDMIKIGIDNAKATQIGVGRLDMLEKQLRQKLELLVETNGKKYMAAECKKNIEDLKRAQELKKSSQ